MTKTNETKGFKSLRLATSKAKKEEKARYKLKSVEAFSHGVHIVVWDSRHPLFIFFGILLTVLATFGSGVLVAIISGLIREEYDRTFDWFISPLVGMAGAFFTSGHYAVLDIDDLWCTVRRERFNLGFSRRYLTRRISAIRYCDDLLTAKDPARPRPLRENKKSALVIEIDGRTDILLKGIDKETAEGILEAIWQRYPGLRQPAPPAAAS